MGAAWDEWPWVISLDTYGETWSYARSIDKTLWNLCTAFDVSVVGIDIGIPTPKRSIIEIPYRSGSVSLTDDDDVMYENRNVSLRLETKGDLFHGYAAIRAFSEAFHGKTGYIYKRQGVHDFGYDPFFHGTMEVSRFDLNGSTFSFSINMDAFPYNIVSFPTPQTTEVYNSVIDFPDIEVPSWEYHLFVALEFDPNYATDGMWLFGNDHLGADAVEIPWGAGSSSLFNANMFISVPNGLKHFFTSAGPIHYVQQGTVNGKITVRYMLCQL